MRAIEDMMQEGAAVRARSAEIRTIDMTPSWPQAAQMICAVVMNGTEEGRRQVCGEIQRMAEIIDRLQGDLAEARADLDIAREAS